MKFNFFSLKYRISFMVFLLEVILLTFVLHQTIGFMQKQINNDFLERQNILLKTLSLDAAIALSAHDIVTLQRKVDIISQGKEVERIQVIGPNQMIMVHSNPSNVGMPYHKTLESDPLVQKSSPIKEIGRLQIDFNHSLHAQRILEAKQLGISIAVIGVLIILIASLLFGHILTRRLNQLHVSMGAFKKGGTFLPITIQQTINDEVSALALVFNTMAADIKRYILQLNQERELLEERVAQRTHELHIANHKLENIAQTDHLTQLKNRRFVEDFLKTEMERFVRSRNIVSIILIDIDFFKRINDKFGHDCGDKVLKYVGVIMQENIREIDLVGRWGGEEFMIVCPNTSLRGAEHIAEKIRYKISFCKFPIIDSLSVSAGISSIQAKDNLDSLIRRADKNLYCAKENGRNCTISG